MSYVVFKLNIQPDILLDYKNSNEVEYLLFNKIPLAFENVLQVEVNESNNLYELIPLKTDEQTFQNLFRDLEEKTVKLFESHKQVLLQFKRNHEIHYSQDFLKLNEACMNKRRDIEKKYPGIMKAYEVIADEEVDIYASIESDSKVGTGITHLRKFYKIKLYLEKYQQDNVINSLDLTAYYNPHTEHVLVKSSSESAAKNYINALVELVNGSRSANKHIGKININPIYETISLDGEYTEISYVIVYPNGNPPLDRYNILKNAEAKEAEFKLVGADGKPLNKEPIQEILENEAKKGYLKSLKARGENIFKKIKTIGQIDKTS
ncbi:hypothetical protein [Shouchella clausii]|uniref:Uncharacterized protein n=1 Tax=Shouchella clausii TaxID=79880 RepID=A0A268NUX7_SHOCL|nr:hypothetical protein [Shouchella clausii]PAE87228.1 hypothetical protein CHH72_19710 [Shouchella clausii]